MTDAGDTPAAAAPEEPPALGVLELGSIARGVVVADAMVKQAPVRLRWSRPLSGGKHLVVVTGEVAEVEEAMGVGVAAAATHLIDRLLLPWADRQLLPFLAAPPPAPGPVAGSVAIVETHTVCAALLAADAAAKAAEVRLLEMRLASGIHGKGYFTMCGELDAVEAAAAAARGVLAEGLLLELEIVPAPHEDLLARLIF